MYQNSSLPLPKRRPEIFCQKLPEDAATAASTPASAEALLAMIEGEKERPTGDNLVGFFLFGELRERVRNGVEGCANRPREGVARCGRRRGAARFPLLVPRFQISAPP